MLQIFFDLLISTRMICGFALYFWHVSFLCTVCLPLLTLFHTSTFITLSFTHIFLYHQPLLSPLLTPMILLFRFVTNVRVLMPTPPPLQSSLSPSLPPLLCFFAWRQAQSPLPLCFSPPSLYGYHSFSRTSLLLHVFLATDSAYRWLGLVWVSMSSLMSQNGYCSSACVCVRVCICVCKCVHVYWIP